MAGIAKNAQTKGVIGAKALRIQFITSGLRITVQNVDYGNSVVGIRQGVAPLPAHGKTQPRRLSMPKLTQERLKELLHYDQDAGIFTWITPPAYRHTAGQKAGSLTSQGYIFIGLDGVNYLAHRLAFLYILGRFPSNTDHIDHDRTNNKWANLREVSNSENHKNRAMSKRNTSGFTGVQWVERHKRWMAKIKVNQKVIYLGYFKRIEDAIEARKKANVKYGFHKNHGAKP